MTFVPKDPKIVRDELKRQITTWATNYKAEVRDFKFPKLDVDDWDLFRAASTVSMIKSAASTYVGGEEWGKMMKGAQSAIGVAPPAWTNWLGTGCPH